MIPERRDWPATIAYPWKPDRGDGTYRNPIICADYSDPDVIRHGDDFYLTASSFNCTPGLPILHSRDLVNWNIINHALENLPDDRYFKVQAGAGVWAPAIRFHEGLFYIFFPTPDEGIYVTTATNPAGKWSEPKLMKAGKGLIDPCPLWDDDGKAYSGSCVCPLALGHQGSAARLPDGSGCVGAAGRRTGRFQRSGKSTDAGGPQVLQTQRILLHPRPRRRRGDGVAAGAAIEIDLRSVRSEKGA